MALKHIFVCAVVWTGFPRFIFEFLLLISCLNLTILPKCTQIRPINITFTFTVNSQCSIDNPTPIGIVLPGEVYNFTVSCTYGSPGYNPWIDVWSDTTNIRFLGVYSGTDKVVPYYKVSYPNIVNCLFSFSLSSHYSTFLFSSLFSFDATRRTIPWLVVVLITPSQRRIQSLCMCAMEEGTWSHSSLAIHLRILGMEMHKRPLWLYKSCMLSLPPIFPLPKKKKTKLRKKDNGDSERERKN